MHFQYKKIKPTLLGVVSPDIDESIYTVTLSSYIPGPTTYTINLNSNNYEIDENIKTGDCTILLKPVTISDSAPQIFYYFGKKPTIKPTINGIYVNDEQNCKYSIEMPDNKDVGKYSYKITMSKDSFYTFDDPNKEYEYEILPQKVSFKMDDIEINVNQSLPTFTFKLIKGTIYEEDSISIEGYVIGFTDPSKEGTYEINGKVKYINSNYEVEKIENGKLIISNTPIIPDDDDDNQSNNENDDDSANDKNNADDSIDNDYSNKRRRGLGTGLILGIVIVVVVIIGVLIGVIYFIKKRKDKIYVEPLDNNVDVDANV